VRGWEGVHQAFQVREFVDQGIMNLTAVNVPPSILAMSLHHWGDELGELMRDYKKAVVAGILCEDTHTGQVRFGPGGRPIPFYQLNDVDIERLKRGTALLCEMLLAAGAKRIILPFGGMPDVTTVDDARRITEASVKRSAIEVVTVHMMGTARMGKRPSRSVCDEFGRVHDADRLFVNDASLFPSCVGVNPAETIQAIATRNAAHIIENRGRYLQ
jgi:choline dehydrogenase-like flavoprotein